jgi:hypothetical protein
VTVSLRKFRIAGRQIEKEESDKIESSPNSPVEGVERQESDGRQGWNAKGRGWSQHVWKNVFEILVFEFQYTAEVFIQEGREAMKKKKRATKSKTRTLPAKGLSAKQAKGVRGGRKAGEKPVEYLKVVMKEVIIT